ncbi:hypothetical protein PYJP_04460 [Pyrofollis japonicus]|uniref:hypothetical protein n=1 Tax=Pyrofollis japonicus TaxID=3060460 RepID=UPI00295B0750|nr:hypothetical protein [Pyrofollis japonicus]BEP17094.1 hypothetical protein PYJP_04460 [Pyrofollis japonicus]
MSIERLEELSGMLASIAHRVRASIRPAESLLESRANTVLSSLSDSLEALSIAIKRLKCIADEKKPEGVIKQVCVTWRIFEQDGGFYVVRLKPETTISLRDGTIRFHRDHVLLEISGTTARLCRWNYCKEFNMLDRRTLIEHLPQLIYLLRHVSNAIRKTHEAVTICAKKEAPTCARI